MTQKHFNKFGIKERRGMAHFMSGQPDHDYQGPYMPAFQNDQIWRTAGAAGVWHL